MYQPISAAARMAASAIGSRRRRRVGIKSAENGLRRSGAGLSSHIIIHRRSGGASTVGASVSAAVARGARRLRKRRRECRISMRGFGARHVHRNQYIINLGGINPRLAALANRLFIVDRKTPALKWNSASVDMRAEIKMGAVVRRHDRDKISAALR
jgi:hypothetical protein